MPNILVEMMELDYFVRKYCRFVEVPLDNLTLLGRVEVASPLRLRQTLSQAGETLSSTPTGRLFGRPLCLPANINSNSSKNSKGRLGD